MSLKIDQDHSRFRAIVRGKIRQNLRKYISQGELIGRKGKDLVSIPLPQIDIPRFKFGSRDKGGVGQGNGDVGDTVGQGDEAQDGAGKAGDKEGEHMLEVELSLDELAQIMDVSGSMGDEQKEVVRIESFWIDTWLRSQYKGLESRFIIHDAVAKEVDRDTFFKTRESGGTMISSAYKLCARMIENDFPPSE